MTERGRLLSKGARRGLYGVFGALGLLSLWPLGHILDWRVVFAVPLTGLVFGLAKLSLFCRSFAQVAGAFVVPWLCLIGFNQILHWNLEGWDGIGFDEARIGLVPGLLLAGVIFAVAATGYLVAWREKRWAIPPVAIVLAVANVVGVPLLLAAPKREKPVGASQPLVSRLDVAIVLPEANAIRLQSVDAPSAPGDWDVRYSVGRRRGDTIDWLLLDSPSSEAALVAARGIGPPVRGVPNWRQAADQLVLLNVDGVPPVSPAPALLPTVNATGGEIPRLLRLARGIAPEAPVAVLLQSRDDARREDWARAVEPTGGAVASVQELGTTTITDAALTLAAQAPGTTEALALALQYRPILLFDRKEELDVPLDINGFLASGRVELCRDDKLSGSSCSFVRRPSELVNGSSHLRIHKAPGGAPPPPSSIYVRPHGMPGPDARKLLFLDYWWYVDGNPARVGAGTTCGVGLSLPGKTCFDHQSDWEGMTVVLDRTSGTPVPVAVQYAQHSAVVRYAWDDLLEIWRTRRGQDGTWPERLRQNLARISDAEQRPIALIAKGTHATYPGTCLGGCRQIAAKLPENPHDGYTSWAGNDTANCIATTCLRLLPTRRGGREGALWNAYDGVWGERDCILRGSYCTAEISPGAPSTQNRYRHPDHITGYAGRDLKFHACGGDRPDCPAMPTG